MKSKLITWLRSREGRRTMALGLSVIAGVMVLGAGWLAAYPFYTDLRAGRHQGDLRQTFSTASFKQDFQKHDFVEGSPVTRLIIPKLGVDIMVVEGISLPALNTGAGHYPGTPLPGEPGNVGIAGHRTMYGKPFNRIDELTQGDKVILMTPVGKYTYEVLPAFQGHANPWVVNQNSWNVVDPTDEPMLTMTACHPKGSAKERIVARARLVSSEEA